MLFRIIITFMLFAGLAYYFNIDVRAVVARSGVPEWLSAKGILTDKQASSTKLSQ